MNEAMNEMNRVISYFPSLLILNKNIYIYIYMLIRKKLGDKVRALNFQTF